MTHEIPVNFRGLAATQAAPGPLASPGREYWLARPASMVRECLEVLVVVLTIALAGWFVPISYHFFGYVYLFTVIALSLRVGRWPVLFAAVVSAVTWNFVFMAPRLSFSVLDVEDSLMLGTYFFAALIGGQLTARIRANEREERQREQRASALLRLSRALAAARTFDEATAQALAQADELFSARSALLLVDAHGRLRAHPASRFVLTDAELAVARAAHRSREPRGRQVDPDSKAEALHVPLERAGNSLGVFSVCLPAALTEVTESQRDLIEAFSAQIALLVEADHLRAAAEREKLLEESDRMHRTLLDSVSHELKTPLAVLRSSAEQLDTDDPGRRAWLHQEIRTAMQRLDHMVANLLNQSRLESGVVRANVDWCDARDLIAAARKIVAGPLAGRAVRVEVAADLPAFLADAALMEHVLANLLLNVARHTPPEAEVTISAGLACDDRRVAIAVADKGPGLPAELRDGLLFQKFQRGPEAKAGGLGLGLSIVRGFMAAQGGDATADANPGGGARFTVTLPFTPHGSVPGDET